MKKLICIIPLLFIWIPGIDNPIEVKVNKISLTLDYSDKIDNFTPENLKKYIEELNIKHPEIVYAQAVLETGNFKSKIFIENNNLFGMKYIWDCNCKVTKNSKRRDTTAKGVRYNHAYYDSWKDSVKDYLLWQQMFKITPIEKKEDYFKLLQNKYAESPIYVETLKKIIK